MCHLKVATMVGVMVVTRVVVSVVGLVDWWELAKVVKTVAG